MMRCGLCGFRYDEKEAQKSCQSCPVTKGCRLIRCPNCGFETPPEPKWLTYIRDLYIRDRFSFFQGEMNGKKENRSHFFFLIHLPLHQIAEVTAIQTSDPKKLQKLIAIGVFPGMKLSLIQKFPSYTFQMGHSQFVIDRPLAECVLCRMNGEMSTDRTKP